MCTNNTYPIVDVSPQPAPVIQHRRSQRSPTYSQAVMIRRNPTLIPMSDLDVQDIRDMVAKQKADEKAKEQLILKMKRLAESPTMQKEDVQMMDHIRTAQTRYRLGLPADPPKE